MYKLPGPPEQQVYEKCTPECMLPATFARASCLELAAKYQQEYIAVSLELELQPDA